MTINLSDVVGITLNGSSVVKIEDSLGTVLWEKNNNAEEYFYIENLTSSANTLSIKKNNASAPTINVYRSTNKTTWTSIGSTSTTAITYSIPANSKVYLKATTNSWSSGEYIYNQITCSGNHAIGGNIMSLLYGDSFIGNTVFPSSSTYNFAHLFSSYNLKNINNLVLPATTLTDYCYSHMFDGCGGLTSIPSYLLPATTLTDNCYSYMFNSTGLTSIPSTLLPATTLANNCYESMFSGTSITSIPSNLLPATTLADSCYSYMFSWSTGLTTVPEDLLPATTLAYGCYQSMFSGCTGLTTIPSTLLPATTLAYGCYQSMFQMCRNITKSPKLPATTLTNYCYQGMFNGCSSLNEITCYANSISAMGCTSNWVNGVAASGTFNKMGSANWTLDSVDGIPTGWTVSIPYFYVENLTNESNTLRIFKSGNRSDARTITVYYSTDKTTWTSMGDTSTSGITYSIPANSKVYLKATTVSWSTYLEIPNGYLPNRIECTGNYAVGGNIMSLLYGDEFVGKTTLSEPYTFVSLFVWDDVSHLPMLKNIDDLILPATTLSKGCYASLFAGCNLLTSIPSNLLPTRSTLANQCYQFMFQGCSSLTSIPSNFLPATTLTERCYISMFSGCTSLTTIPSNLLPATTLAGRCYESMFGGCRNITNAPILPATTLKAWCYRYMFKNCNKLNEITCYADDISANLCTDEWVDGVSSTGTFNKMGSAEWTTGISGIPSGWTVVE